MAKRKNSRQKGAAGEREVAEWLRQRGVSARRGVQFQGGPDSPDVVHELEGVHLEVKRTETLRLNEAMEQAASEAPEGSIPVVLHRKNRGKWVAILDAEDWLGLELVARMITGGKRPRVVTGRPNPSDPLVDLPGSAV